ncbi:MAG: ubiquitin family protein [Candidatus Heimdallarchaeota archaeon]|nr:ubiquitin family protein [Candidatus Heimdallarchaeota archaeon]MDH5646727.1 ubiquitin family protein [Candidatus Heimdallarchaeota archaeon]
MKEFEPSNHNHGIRKSKLNSKNPIVAKTTVKEINQKIPISDSFHTKSSSTNLSKINSQSSTIKVKNHVVTHTIKSKVPTAENKVITVKKTISRQSNNQSNPTHKGLNQKNPLQNNNSTNSIIPSHSNKTIKHKIRRIMTKTPKMQNKIKQIFVESTIGPAIDEESKSLIFSGTIREIKENISEMYSLPIDEFNICHKGRILDENKTLKSYKIKNNDTLQIIPVSIAA